MSSDLKIDIGTYKNYVGGEALAVIDKGYTIQSNFPGPAGNDGGFKRTFFGGQTGDFEAV